MFRHQHHADKQEAEEKPIRRRSYSHHGPLLLKPTCVINHLKKKVKHKREEKGVSIESSHSVSVQDINGNINNNNNRPSSQNHHGSILVSSNRSRSFTLPATLSNGKSFSENAINNYDENSISIENEEENSMVPHEVDEDHFPWRTNHTSLDTVQEMIQSKPKLIQATKSLPETTSQTNVKKRRQTIRRTGFQLRDEDFSVIFSDLPSDEQLIIAFPCAWRKDIFMHGRMFLSFNYFCFYTCFFKWEESLCIPFNDIISITREKSVRLVPNAIKVRTKNQEQYLFASLTPREKLFISVFRLWQNALLEQPLDYQQLRALVYADQQNHDESSGESEESINLENNGEVISESGLYPQSLPLTSKRSSEPTNQSKKSQRPIVSLPSDNETRNYLSTCTCETHPAKTYAERVFTLSVDTLFELVCGDNAFTRDFHNSQKLTEYTYGEWILNNETDKRERVVTYKTVSQSVLGSNTLTCREKQILEVEKPHLIYILSTEVYNEGMKYTDAFYVVTKFCMVQRDAEHCSLRISAEINYIKNVNGFIKTFIEKNSNSYLENGINEQVRRFEHYQDTQMKRKSNQKSMSVSKEHARKKIKDEMRGNQAREVSSVDSNALQDSDRSMTEKSMTGKVIIYDIGIMIGISLLLLHIYLCYKLHSIDQSLVTSETMCLKQCEKTCLENTRYR